ncbi:unnamed protein product [Cylindrotheca closterium]|uniref:Disease resistance R13L4/SHOC-2-like LRR domain-containing protein n=1 Tax=Cylindrotheca closterium TaxID=2856 RepID=A0AAD2GB95_9STRA|nr:unnamed protein product [Cylindrotheca closterium]
MSVSGDEKEVPYNDEAPARRKSPGGLAGLTGMLSKKMKSSKSNKSHSSFDSEDSSVPPPPKSGYHAPSEGAKSDESSSEDDSVPDGRQGYYQPTPKTPKEKKEWLPKFGKKSRSVNMAGDIEGADDKDTPSEAFSESTPVPPTEWMNEKVAMVLAIVVLIMFAVLIAVVALAIEDSLEPPTSAPTIPRSIAPTFMPSRMPSVAPTVTQRDPIPSYASYFGDFRSSVQSNRRQGYLSSLDDDSPQVQAYNWVTRSGSNCCSFPQLSPLFLFERYIVITILFGTQDGYPWPDNWREEWKESSVCDWRTPLGIGVFCDNGGLIRELSLRNLYVGEEFPPEIGLLSNLQILSLASWNGHGFTIPMEVGRLENLEFLKISSTQNLQGTLPSEVGKLTKLTILSLRDNHLDGTLPSEVGNLTILRTLQLDNNSFTGTIPDDIGRLGTLQNLVLSNNEFDSSIPAEVNQLTTLEELRLDENMFSGTIPNNLSSLTGLRWLNLESNVDANGNILLEGNLNALCDAGGGQLQLRFKADCNSNKITCYCCFCFG